MKIINLYADNVKKLRVVDITPSSHVVKISGDNGQGKTSVLDCILYALAGIDSIPPEPVRSGEPQADIVLDVGEYTIRRTIYAGRGTELTIKNRRGEVQMAPQKLLNNLLSRIAFDPLTFVRLGKKEQAAELRRLVTLDVDVEELDKLNAADYAARMPINKRFKELEAKLTNLPAIPANIPDEPIDISEMLSKVQDAHDHNGRVDAQKAQRALHAQRAQQNVEHLEKLEHEIAELHRQIEAKVSQVHQATIEKESEVEKRDAVVIDAVIDTAAMTEEVRNAEARNKWVQTKRERAEWEREKTEKEEESAQLGMVMKGREDEKRRALAEAKMPISGLALKGEIVYYNDKPLEQASGAEQVRIGLAVAMAGQPKLRIIRITDATMLGPAAMKMVEELAMEHDFQVWMEVVDTTGETGIVMVEGEVQSTPESRAKAASPAKKQKKAGSHA